MKPASTLTVSSLLLLALATIAPARADLNSDLAFTAFQNVDLNALAGGQVLQSRGGLLPFPRGIISQSLYVIDAQPADVAAKLVHWNPATHPELKVWLHQSIPMQATPASFAALANLPDNSSVKFQIDSTANFNPSSTTLQLSQAEGQIITSLAAQEKDPKALYVKAWSQILAGRVADFFAGRGGNDYDLGGSQVHPLNDVKSLFHADPKIYGAYQRLLNQTPAKALANTAGAKLTPMDVYCDVFDVEGSTAVGTGAIFQAPSGNSIQSADMEYYTNYGVYATVELEQLWPVTINGKAETLVWRDDLVSAPSIEYLHGTERLASTMIMLQETKQGVDAFRSEFK